MRLSKKQAIIAAVVLLAIATALAFIKPERGQVVGSIPAELVSASGANYSGVYNNFLVFSIARGRNVKTAESATYVGMAGRVFEANGGLAHALADVFLWLPALMDGAAVTVSLTILAVIAGLFLSVFLALGKLSRNPAVNAFCSAYIFFFRGSPLLMQLFFIYYGLPAINPALAINNKFLAAFIAFSLNTGAYCAEIIRAAIQSIDKGQFEASRVLGLTYGQTMRIVIIPQSIRRLLPPVANEFIMILKDASLVSIIALADLTHVTRSISSSANNVMVYIPAMVIYLLITAFFTAIFTRLEKRFSIYQ